MRSKSYSFSVSPKYVSWWGLFECVRELLQNAKDAEDDHGWAMKYDYQDGGLLISNEMACLTIKSLMIGQSDKEGKGLRGKFGEGLGLALLVAAREGRRIEVRTDEQVWLPYIENDSEIGDHMVVSVKDHETPMLTPFVSVFVGMTETEWAEIKSRFLFVQEADESIKTPYGDLILDESKRGNIYVKGIFVESRKNIKHAYDLESADLDRDRRMVAGYELGWRITSILEHATNKQPERFAGVVYRMINDGESEADGFRSGSDCGEFRKHMVNMFQEQHGTNARASKSIQESKELQSAGYVGIVVSDGLYRVLIREMGDTRDLLEGIARKYSYIQNGDLSEGEAENLEHAMECVNGALKQMRIDNPYPVHIGVFKDPNIDGLYIRKGNLIVLSHSCLNRFRTAVRCLVHEIAHAVTGAADGEHAHIEMMEDIWSLITEELYGRQYD